MTTDLHRQRFAAVLDAIRASGARTVLDLGCGDGELTLALAREPGVERLLGVDLDTEALETLRAKLHDQPEIGAKISFRQTSYLTPDPTLRGFDAVAMVETIEHIDPTRLSNLEQVVFTMIAAPLVVITTPNADFNSLLGVPEHRMRHPDHRFEWGRERFARWATGVAARHDYDVDLHDIGGSVPGHGGPSQMAVFSRSPGTR
jgi:3' terminal RNA ribose 2'-O-methyltransferase Hen1